jgi:hypothetical protein
MTIVYGFLVTQGEISVESQPVKDGKDMVFSSKIGIVSILFHH